MPALLRGIGLALAVAVPAALLAQLLDVVTDSDPGLLTYPLTLVVLAGMALGGREVGRRAADRAIELAALAGLVAMAVVQAVGIARRAVAGEDVAWATVPVVTLLGVGLAAAAAARSRGATARAGRTRP